MKSKSLESLEVRWVSFLELRGQSLKSRKLVENWLFSAAGLIKRRLFLIHSAADEPSLPAEGGPGHHGVPVEDIRTSEARWTSHPRPERNATEMPQLAAHLHAHCVGVLQQTLENLNYSWTLNNIFIYIYYYIFIYLCILIPGLQRGRHRLRLHRLVWFEETSVWVDQSSSRSLVVAHRVLSPSAGVQISWWHLVDHRGGIAQSLGAHEGNRNNWNNWNNVSCYVILCHFVSFWFAPHARACRLAGLPSPHRSAPCSCHSPSSCNNR